MDHRQQSSPARMLIAEFATATGLSRDTIRFYVRKALLHPKLGSTTNNRYMTFDDADVERALLIRLAQSLGFTLREIGILDAESSGGELTPQRQAALLRERMDAIDAQIASLRAVRHYISQKADWLDAGSVGSPPALTSGDVDRFRERAGLCRCERFPVDHSAVTLPFE